MRKVRINSCSELSETQFYPVGIVKAIERLTVALKSIFMAEEAMSVHNQPVFPGQLLAEHNIWQRRISLPVVFAVGPLALWRDIYPCNITITRGYTPINHGKTSLQ